MGMPEQTQKGMNIAPDGTIYEILEDGTIKRIGKVSPDGEFEKFGRSKDGIWFCPNCGAENEADNNFCGKCGTRKPESSTWNCPNCGKKDIKSNFCPDCGTKKQIAGESMYIDRGDYIELTLPIGNIRMIEKVCHPNRMNWDDAMQYAKNLRKGGYNDWRVPTKEELEEIYKIKDVCGINKCDDWFWSSSAYVFNTNIAWLVDFYDSRVYAYNKSYNFNVRCVR